jgi:hypothetical protein
VRAQFVLHQAGRRGEKHIRRNRGHDDRIQIAGGNAALDKRFLRRFDRQIAGRNALVHDMALADADTAHNPFVVRIDEFFEIGVGEKTRRNVGAESADLNALKLAQ